MPKIKGWEKVREDRHTIAWRNDNTQLTLVVNENNQGWHHSAALNQYYPTKAAARKVAVRWMRSRPNG